MHKRVRAAATSALAIAVIGCGIKDPGPFDAHALQRSERASAPETPQMAMRALPTTLEALPPVTEPTTRPTTFPVFGSSADVPTIRLPLREIIQRSVANSAEVHVAGYDPAIAKTRILEAEARYDPVAFTNFKYDHTDNANAGQVIQDPLNPTRTKLLDVQRADVITVEPGVKQLLPGGGQAQISYQDQYNYLTPRQFVRNPYWTDELKLQFTQPLLRDFGYEVNYARIAIARNDTRVSVLDFRKTLEENVSELEKDYWQLAEAEREVEIQENLLELTRDTADILIKQFQQGGANVSRVQTSQASAAIRSREAVLIRARAHVQDFSDDIKRRMNDPELPISGQVVILPGTAAVESPIHFDLEDQIDTAMDNRLELGQQQIRIDSAGTAYLVGRNNLLPKLDLATSIGLQGLGTNNGSALNQQLSDGHFSWSLGFTFEFPLGNREARAILSRARLQREQAIEQYRFLIAQISEDVKTALREVNTTWEEMGARRQARFTATDALQGLQQQQEAGEALTPTFVQLKLDTQERLAEAQREEALAISNYNIAIARLEKAKGTLLRYNNVVMEEQKLGPLGR